MKTKFIKSPMNWPGNKYKLLNQLVPLFPSNINNFIDLFCGGLDVSCNITAQHKYANDINKYLIDIYKAFQEISLEELINFIDMRINEFQLTRYNYDGFILYRRMYNMNEKYHTPLDLFVLSRFAFNTFIRFQNDKYNESFGFDHCDFNLVQRKHTKFLHQNIQNINFSSLNFLDFNISNLNSNDFIYIDPPYLISGDVYKLPKADAWNETKEYQLYEYLDNINKKGLKFGLSNIISHKGKTNDILINWMDKYNIHDIYSNYSNSFSNLKKYSNDVTIEIFVTNY